MIKYLTLLAIIPFLIISCGQEEAVEETQMDETTQKLQERIDLFAPTVIEADISHLTDRQKKVIHYLVKAGQYADEIFWHQTSPSAKPTRDSLIMDDSPEAKVALEFVNIMYGPYDLIMDGKRMLGEGPEYKPETANFYPPGMTREEFNSYVETHPDQKEALESQYTVVVREDDGSLMAIPYYQAYEQQIMVANYLDSAADYCDNASLQNYLKLRAEALRSDNYFRSDMAWMELDGNDIDVIIGPIENYEDKLFNYKTAFEAVVVVKDHEGTEELQMFKSKIQEFEDKLPYDDKYKRSTVGEGTYIFNIVNVVYFGGDAQAGTKTIACNLPNDPEVRKVKGGKNTMYKNMMQAKFNKIVVPIAEKILVDDLAGHADANAFSSFVTLHELSHSLGLDYVFGNDELKVRTALKERYSAIEETKADILSMFNHKHLVEDGTYTEEYGKKAVATYLAGLYRSIRFGTESAHGRANVIQLNYLRESGAITRNEDGKFDVNWDIFYDKVAELAEMVLVVRAEGDYEGAGEILEKYGQVSSEIEETIESLSDIPRDLNTSYKYAMEMEE